MTVNVSLIIFVFFFYGRTFCWIMWNLSTVSVARKGHKCGSTDDLDADVWLAVQASSVEQNR